MSDHEFPLLIASIDSDSHLCITEQAQSFFASSAVKASSPATLISCISSTSTLFPNLFNNLLSSCLIRAPPSPGIWLRHLHQQDEQPAAATTAHRPASLPKKGAVASPPRDDNSGPVILLLDVVSDGLSEAQAARLFTLAYSLSSHMLVGSEACELSLDFSFSIAIAHSIQISDSEKSAVDRLTPPELFWCLSPGAVSIRNSSCPDEISPNNPNFMENCLRTASDHSHAICSLFSHRYQVLDGSVMSLEKGLEEALQCSKKTKGRRSVGVDFAAVMELTAFLCSTFNENSEPQPIFESSHEFLLKLSCKRAVARGIQEFNIVFNCRSPSSSLEEALASAHSAALRLYDKKTEGNAFASDFRDSLRTDIMQHGCSIREREGALVANTTRSKLMSMWTSVGGSDQAADDPSSKIQHAIQRLRGLAKLFVDSYPQCEQEQNEEMLKAYVAHGAINFLLQSDALEHLASTLQDAHARSRHQDRRASVDAPMQEAAVPVSTNVATTSNDTGSVPLKYIILEAEVEKLKDELLREQRKTARYEKQIESILSQHSEEFSKANMQVEELKSQLAQTHRRLARSQEKLTESEEGQLIKTIHAKELMIESLQEKIDTLRSEMSAKELTIYHQDQELQMKKAELRSNQHGGSSHKEKSGWGSKLGRFFLGTQHDSDTRSLSAAPPMEGLGPI